MKVRFFMDANYSHRADVYSQNRVIPLRDW
jgi:hypothetical protein